MSIPQAGDKVIWKDSADNDMYHFATLYLQKTEDPTFAPVIKPEIWANLKGEKVEEIFGKIFAKHASTIPVSNFSAIKCTMAGACPMEPGIDFLPEGTQIIWRDCLDKILYHFGIIYAPNTSINVWPLPKAIAHWSSMDQSDIASVFGREAVSPLLRVKQWPIITQMSAVFIRTRTEGETRVEND